MEVDTIEEAKDMRYKTDVKTDIPGGSDWGVCLEVFSGLYQQQQRSRYEKENCLLMWY